MTYSTLFVRTRVLLALSNLAFAIPLAAQTGNTLTFQPSSVKVSVQQGKLAPVQDVQVVATRSNVEYSVSLQSQYPGLLNIAGTQFTTPGKFTIFFGSAPAGHYEGKVIVTASGNEVTNPTTEIPVIVDVTSGPALSVSPNPVTLSVLKDAAAFTQSVTVASNGDPIAFTAAATGTTGAINWLSIAQTTGTTGTNNVTLNVAPLGLGAGTYSGSLTITPANSTTSTVVPVNLTVTAAAQLSVDNPSLSFVYQVGQAAPAAQTVNVSNAAGGQLTYATTVSTPNTTVNWLRVPATGTAPGPLSISVDPTNLTAGTYTGTVTLTASGVANLTANIQVQLIVSTTSLLTVSPATLTFETQPNVNPNPKNVTVYSTSAAQTYSTQLQTGSDWIFLAAGNTATPQGSSVTVAPFVVGKTVGTYTSKLIITTPAGAATPTQTIEVPITVKITQATTLTSAPAQLTFDILPGTAGFQRKDVTINSSDAQTTSYTVSISPASAQIWLFTTTASGTVSSTTPATMGILVNPAGLTATRNDAEVILTPAAGSNAQVLHIPVTARLNNGQVTFTTTPTGTVTFTADPRSAPQSKIVHLTSDPTASDFLAQSQNLDWLQVSPLVSNTGAAGTDLTITVNPLALNAGVYNGMINVVSTAGTTTNPFQIPVKLTVGTPATIAVTPANLTFNYSRGQAAPAQQSISVTSGTTAATFAVTSSTNNGNSTWIVPVVTSTTTPATVGVKVDPTGLSPGTYTGSVVVTGQGTANGPQTVGITLFVQDLPTPVITDIQNGASFQNTAAAPGLIITIRGSNMGPLIGVSAQAVNGVMPTVLSDTKVFFDTVAAPVLYVSENQVNAIIPYQVYGRVSTSVQIERFGVRSNAILLAVKDAQPAIFTLDPGGHGQGAILNENYSVNGTSNAAPRGSIVQIFATGEGETSPSGTNSNGKIIGTDLRKPITGPVTARIAGQNAEVTYYGSAPGLVAGAFQVNVRVPTTIGPGNQALEIQVGPFITQTNVAVAVK